MKGVTVNESANSSTVLQMTGQFYSRFSGANIQELSGIYRLISYIYFKLNEINIKLGSVTSDKELYVGKVDELVLPRTFWF
jgi:hypothetical protein